MCGSRRKLKIRRLCQSILSLFDLFNFFRLPETVLWFEPPLAANWDPVNQYWSTEEIHDVKFNEDKQV